MRMLEYFGIRKQKETKDEKKEKTLEEWKEKVMKDKIKKVGSNEELSPALYYIIQHCFKCFKFNPERCFNEEGLIYTREIVNCIKVRSYLENKDNYQTYEQMIKEQLERI